MQVVHPVCCGIDGHPQQLTACGRQVGEDGTVHTEWREFATTYGELLALRQWLDEQDCPIVVLESPEVYWKPIYHVLVEAVEVVLANARSVRQRPGKKTDKADAAWLAELLAHGLVQPSFLPSPVIQAWCDLTRTRVALVQNRTQMVANLLEDDGLLLATSYLRRIREEGRQEERLTLTRRHLLQTVAFRLTGAEADPQALAQQLAARADEAQLARLFIVAMQSPSIEAFHEAMRQALPH